MQSKIPLEHLHHVSQNVQRQNTVILIIQVQVQLITKQIKLNALTVINITLTQIKPTKAKRKIRR